MRRVLSLLLMSTLVLAGLAEAGTITRPSKSFGGTSWITGVVPTAADFNGDIDTVYSEINGSIANVNVSASAAIAGSKISPAFTLDTSVTTGTPCRIWTESDEAADAQRWYACVSAGTWGLTTRTDAGAIQATPIQINRSTGAVTLDADSFATQAQMETGTSLLVPVPPGRVQNHPGVAKGWGKFNLVAGIVVSYNVASITDTGPGQVSISWDTDFSGNDYVVIGTAQNTDSSSRCVMVSNTTTPVTGTTLMNSENCSGTLTDPVLWHVVAFGDQ